MKTCIVVDDSSIVRKVARLVLESLDFRVSEAENGESALRLCRQAMPDGVLLDWDMPVMNGHDFLRQLRQLPGGDQPKVVFLTTENDVAQIARAFRAGANECLLKPFERDHMTAKLQDVGLV